MSNIPLIDQMVACYNSMDADGLRDLLHKDAKHTAPGSDFGAEKKGSETIITYFKEDVFPSFNQVRFDADHIYEDVERSAVVVEWTSHLWPKTGKNYSNNGVFVIEIQDGKIHWVREYFDTEKSHENVN